MQAVLCFDIDPASDIAYTRVCRGHYYTFKLSTTYLHSLLQFTIDFRLWLLPYGDFIRAITTRGFPASPSIMRSAELRSGWSRVHHAVADGSRSNFGAPRLLPTTNQRASAQSWILISCHVINKFHIWHVTSRKFKRKTTLIGWTKWRYVLCTIYGHDVQEIPDRLMHRKTGFPQ